MKWVFVDTLGFLVLLTSTVYGQAAKPEQPKSESAASGYSLFGTLLPVIVGGVLVDSDADASDPRNTVGISILSLGLLVGPGLGHLYANNGQFGKGLVFRGAAFATFVYGGSQWDIFDDDDDAAGLMAAGALLLVYSAVHDIKTADRSAREFNTRHRLSRLELQPYVPGSSNSIGIAFTFRY